MITEENRQNVTKTFEFSFPTCTNEDVLFKLQVPVQIPHGGSTRELVQRVINMFNIPVYLEEELNEKLAKFVSDETKNFHNERDEKLLNQLKNSEINVDSIVKNWEKLFKDNVLEYAEQKGTSDEEVFGAAYHKLVHSPALETILQVERTYARTVADMLKNREEDIAKITQRQTEEMEEKVKLLNTFTTEDDINALAASHFEEQSMVEGRWGSQLDALWHAQREEYRTWIMTMVEEYQGSEALNTPSNSPLGLPPLPAPPASRAAEGVPRLEESFTIHLGSQLKQTHNLRIVAMDVMDLCRAEGESDSSDLSTRLQTALGLYSSSLSCVVLLCPESDLDSSPLGESGLLQERARAATEYHFPAPAAQLQAVAERLSAELDKRPADASPARRRRRLRAGDIYVTRHSNLAEVHVVFHLVVDDSVRSGDINSRHPVILGLRNILKTCCCHDVTNITLPLLLTHELTDEMTAAWCVRRAELVLKCVKGFMLETGSWGGAALRGLQVAAPPQLAPPVFQSLARLLPQVFRTPTPLKLNTE
ncbi:unnamed protein product [Plutella xylostella]|uniref:(diamondback moth) hypothetical protein n=1 Tax=Plutella xylostella TaxID=51655 RepID=A0A8S4G0C9_PLUXY|nr:unnamed protein product [Plutella xylostella]